MVDTEQAAVPCILLVEAILEAFQQVLNPEDQLPQTTCNMAHFLSTRAWQSHRWLDPKKMEAAQKELEALEAPGIIHPSTST